MPSVIQKEKEAYQYWLALYQNFPKIERFSIGQKISQLFINLLELSFTAAYLPPDQKIILLGENHIAARYFKIFRPISLGEQIDSN